MQANSQHLGQLQNSHGEGATPGNRTSQNFYQLCLPPRTTSPSYSGQTATGNYFTCTVQSASNEQISASHVQATNGIKFAQENQLNSNHTGKQDSQIILWNMPSNCQIILPVTSINLQGAPSNNGPNISHRAFNSSNSLYMHQQTTSPLVGSNNLQFKTIDTQSLNETSINTNSRQHYQNANLPINSSKTRTSLPSDLNYCPPTENAHHGPSSLFGGRLYQVVFAEKSNNANGQMLSTCAQNLQTNNAAQKAVAVVTPLSPIEMVPANFTDRSANVKMNISPVQETVHHQTNIPPPLVPNANLMNQSGEPSALPQPQSAEPRLNHGLCSIVGANSPVLANESTDQSLCTSSPNLKCVVTEQSKSVPAQMQNEPAEKTNKNRTVTDKKTIDPDTVPVIEWPLDRLKTLISVYEPVENEYLKNNNKSDPGKEILKLYWNGDSTKFTEAAESGIYLSIMEEVYMCAPMNEPVILRQIVNDARSKVIKDFHVLKHNEVPPKTTYTSCWLNLNENIDDIDKECGYSWFYKSFQNIPENEAQNLACEALSPLQEAPEKPSLNRTKQLPSEVENMVPADDPTSKIESFHENGPNSFNGPSLAVANINCSPKYNYQVTSSQTVITNSPEAMVDLDERGVPTRKSSLGNQFRSVVSPKSTSHYTNSQNPTHVVAEQQEIVSSSQMQVGSSQKLLQNNSVFIDNDVRCETTPKPSQKPPVHMNEVETDKMDVSATKINNLPRKMAGQCFANEVRRHQVTAAFPEKHKAPLLNTRQVLDTISTEEPISRQKLEDSASSRVQALILAQYKSSSAECNPITDKIQQEKQVFLKRNIYNKIYEESVSSNSQSPPVIDNVFLKLNEQPSAVNPLKGMKNLVRGLERRNVSLMKYKKVFEKHGGLKMHKPASRLNNSFGMSVRAQNPILVDDSSSQSDYTIKTSAPSPVVENQELVPLSKAQNEFTMNECQELSVQTNEEFAEMDALSSITLDVLTQEVAKRCFTENKDIATATNATLRLDDPLCNQAKSPVLADKSTRQIDYASPPKLYPVLTVPSQTRNKLDEEMPEIDCILSDKSVRSEADPKPIQELSVNVNEEEFVKMDASASIKISVLPHKVAKQWFTSQSVQYKDNAASPVCIQHQAGNCDILKSPPTLHPVLAVASQIQSDEEMLEIGCVIPDKSVRSDADPKPDQELPVEMNEEEISGLDTSVCIKINVLPQEVAMQCFADLIKKDKDTAVSPEKKHNMCRLESPVLTEGSRNPSACASPPKLDHVMIESSKVQDKSSDKMPDIDCMLKDEGVNCETDLNPTQELPGKEETYANIDGLVSIKIDVLPPEMAELWFAGEMEDKKFQKDTTVCNSTGDRVKVEVLELKSEKEKLLEDVKLEEGKCPISGGKSLESYCCLAKWFQMLECGNGSLCMCQIKAELKGEIKIEEHSSLEVQAEKDSLSECQRVEMDDAALERTDDSEATDDSEDEWPLLHNPTTDKTKIVKDISSPEEVSKAETKTSEQKSNESAIECATNMILTNEIEQDTPDPDLKNNTVCLALFGSSSEKRNKLKLTKRRKETSSCEKPPKTLEVAVSSHLKVKNKSEPKKRKSVTLGDEDNIGSRKRIQRESLQHLVQRKSLPSHPVSGLGRNGLSSTSVRQPLKTDQSGNVKSDVHLAEANKRKRSRKRATQQMSMNKYIVKGKSLPCKLLNSPESVKKSKYELGNPALMPLDEGPALEFKVLPETFHLEDGAELDCAQAETSESMQNEMSGLEENIERMETSHVPTKGVWSFSPLRKKCTQPIQDADVSGSCSLFQVFKKKYLEKKDITSKQNLNSSEIT